MKFEHLNHEVVVIENELSSFLESIANAFKQKIHRFFHVTKADEDSSLGKDNAQVNLNAYLIHVKPGSEEEDELIALLERYVQRELGADVSQGVSGPALVQTDENAPLSTSGDQLSGADNEDATGGLKEDLPQQPTGDAEQQATGQENTDSAEDSPATKEQSEGQAEESASAENTAGLSASTSDLTQSTQDSGVVSDQQSSGSTVDQKGELKESNNTEESK